MANEKVKHVEGRPARGEARAERVKRVPINGIRDILAVRGIREGFHPCWVNEPLVPRYLEAGYTFVDYDVTFGAQHVNQGNTIGARYARDVGKGMIAYLMEIPQEYYDEDRLEEQAEVDAVEGSIRGAAPTKGLDHGDFKLDNRTTK